jgi:hypothetical protein
VHFTFYSKENKLEGALLQGVVSALDPWLANLSNFNETL